MEIFCQHKCREIAKYFILVPIEKSEKTCNKLFEFSRKFDNKKN